MGTMLYRIFTERKNIGQVKRIVNSHFDGFTILKAKGYWKGQEEDSLVIEIIGDMLDRQVEEVAKEIKDVNHQEAVLIQTLENNSKLV